MAANAGKSLADIASTSKLILVGEYTLGHSEMNISAVGNVFAGHLGAVNYLFADGHVKSMKPTATGSPVNMWNIEDNTADADPTLMGYLRAWDAKAGG